MNTGRTGTGKSQTTITAGDLTYEWLDGWATLPDTEAVQAAWPHHGIVVTAHGDVITFHPAEPRLLAFDRDGALIRSSPELPCGEAHGMTLVVDGGVERLWLADAANRRAAAEAYAPPEQSADSTVLKVELDGRVVMQLARPPHAKYADGAHYRPTSVAVDEERFGGDGTIWVADGYGQSLVHRFDRQGRYVGTLSGEEGGGRFQGPHAVHVDRRRGVPELYIADRTNARIQVYDMDGGFRRIVGAGVLASPTWFVSDGHRLFIVEFRPPRLTVLGPDDELLGHLCEDTRAPSRPGWPNELAADGRAVRTKSLRVGKLNSPHAVAIDGDGSLYLTEWLIGGRFTKLRRVDRL